jgi:hypothetical protein
MDITDAYEGLDLVLGEPGLIEDTRVEDAAAAQVAVDADEAVRAALAIFDRARMPEDAGVTCMIRLDRAALDPGAASAVSRRVLDRLRHAIRAPDTCELTDRGDFALALAGCDVETARKRTALMMRLVEMEPILLGKVPLWAGIAPIGGPDSTASLRTAELACDLAAFQPSGHVEVIEL